MQIIDHSSLDDLFRLLRTRGYTVIAPTIRDGAIVYAEIGTASELPAGWTDEQAPGEYRLRRTDEFTLFGYVVGPHSWKRFLNPPRVTLFTAQKNGRSFEVESGNGTGTRYAFVGVRSCELNAILIQDRVLVTGPYTDQRYAKARQGTFIVAVDCVHVGENCFCASMQTGPEAKEGFDLCLTEICNEDSHKFAARAGSAAGEDLLRELAPREASNEELEWVRESLSAAARSMGRTLQTTDLPRKLNENFEHPRWEAVAKRCLGCGNCTLVCPTCFCNTVEDVTDLEGDRAERTRRWDSCYASDFTKIAGGNIRITTRSRYRQWLMHKLSFWVDQFETFGCVGCGRCITWCPAGIDITEEAAAVAESITAMPAA